MIYKLPMFTRFTKKPSVSKLIIEYMPTFAWQTSTEVLTMLEQIDEDIAESTVDLNLTKLYQRGLLDRKIVRKAPGQTGVQLVFAYIRK